jgi:Uma2 family endonuclease
MATVPSQFITPEQYLEVERKAETKSEYYRGEMFAMSGASLPHALLTTRLAAMLDRRIGERDCSVASSNLRVLVAATGLYTYPDVVVFCGQPRFADSHFDTLLNPVMIAEVLSPSTEAYDRGRKFQHCRGLESLRHYLLIAQDRMNVDVFTLERERWVLTSASRPEDIVRLEGIGCEIPVGELYEKVVFPADETPQPPAPDAHRI